MLQYQLHEYESGTCFKRKYNINRNVLSNEISHELEAESSLIREKKNKIFDKLIDKCVRIQIQRDSNNTKKKRKPVIFEEYVNPLRVWDLVRVYAGVKYRSDVMSTRSKNTASWFLVGLDSSVSNSRWSKIDVTLLVLYYLLVTYRAALHCTISITFFMCT